MGKKQIVKYAVQQNETDAIIIVEDGGVATIHHNGFHLLTTYYQDRADKFTFDDHMWDKLAEGKEYLHDWEDKQVIDDDVIIDAIDWLYVSSEGFEFKKVEFINLVTEYNSPKIKKIDNKKVILGLKEIYKTYNECCNDKQALRVIKNAITLIKNM